MAHFGAEGATLVSASFSQTLRTVLKDRFGEACRPVLYLLLGISLVDNLQYRRGKREHCAHC